MSRYKHCSYCLVFNNYQLSQAYDLCKGLEQCMKDFRIAQKVKWAGWHGTNYSQFYLTFQIYKYTEQCEMWIIEQAIASPFRKILIRKCKQVMLKPKSSEFYSFNYCVQRYEFLSDYWTMENFHYSCNMLLSWLKSMFWSRALKWSDDYDPCMLLYHDSCVRNDTAGMQHSTLLLRESCRLSATN